MRSKASACETTWRGQQPDAGGVTGSIAEGNTMHCQAHAVIEFSIRARSENHVLSEGFIEFDWSNGQSGDSH